VSSESLEIVKTQYQAGKAAYERGQYRQSVQHLEKARSLVERNSSLGGEVLLWLVTAYEAAGQRPEAIALCNQLTQHPDLETRKQGRRLLYILEAPQLRTRPEWLVEIPDLTALDKGEEREALVSNPSSVKRSPPRPKQPQPEPVDLGEVNIKDNRFIWIALAVAVAILGSLLWLSPATG
jgi:tetratricopeptide (TPR) repeat protein